MSKQYSKIDDNTIQISEVVPQVVVSTFIYNDLVARVDNLKSDLANYTDKKNQEIADAQADVDAATQLQIVSLVTLTPPAK